MHERNPETSFCYIARRECGCICFVTIDDPSDVELRRANAKDIGDCMKEGFTVERLTVAAAKADPAFFPKECPHKPKACMPAPLFATPGASV